LDGSLRLVDLKLRNEVIGSFDARVQSDGSKLALRVDSSISPGELHGDVDVSLAGAYPLSGQVTVSQIDLDPLIVSALHLTGLTGHSQIDGQMRSEEHTSELQSRENLVCRLLLEKKKKKKNHTSKSN